MNIKDFYSLTKGRIFEVKFIKKDGTDRILKGTCNLKNIPEEFHPKEASTNLNEKIFRVFDLENNGWRSLDIERVTELTLFNNKNESLNIPFSDFKG